MSTRGDLIAQIAENIDGLRVPAVTRVGVDGIDGAGKTVLADELAAALVRSSRYVIRAGIESFRDQERYDVGLLRERLLDPLSPGGTGRFRRTRAGDVLTDAGGQAEEMADTGEETAAGGAILVFDGAFLHDPELRGYWDYSIFLRVGFAVATARCARRAGLPTGFDVRDLERQRRYLLDCEPDTRATVVVDNESLREPFIVDR